LLNPAKELANWYQLPANPRCFIRRRCDSGGLTGLFVH
jgi:hypothetical protein